MFDAVRSAASNRPLIFWRGLGVFPEFAYEVSCRLCEFKVFFLREFGMDLRHIDKISSSSSSILCYIRTPLGVEEVYRYPDLNIYIGRQDLSL